MTKILTAQYWPRRLTPSREGAMVRIIWENKVGAFVTGFDGSSWFAHYDELDVLVSTEEDNS